MKTLSTLSLWTAAFALLFVASWNRAEDLKLGDPAPKLYVSKWLNGDAVGDFEKDKVYVVECWATWCGPCRAAIPHVSEMNTKLKDKGVVFIGMNVWERSLEQVEPFVKSMGEKMNYRVALDAMEGGEGKTAKAWLTASGQTGIPCSFIVDKQGKVAWIGHPMTMEKVLEQVIAGTFDTKKYAENKVKLAAAQQKFETAAQANDGDAMLKAIDEIVALDETMADQMEAVRFKVLLLIKKQYDEAYKIGDKVADGMLKDNPQALNDFAWTVLDSEGIEKRNLDLALKWATRADELTKHSDGAVLDTLARANFEKGNVDKAIEIETLAIEKMQDPNGKAEMTKALGKYKQKKG